jgi:hypothetical protein
MGAAAWWTERVLQAVWPSHRVVVMHLDLFLTLRLGAAVATGIVVLVLTSRLLRLEELDQAARRVLTRLGRRPSGTPR